MHGRSTTPSAFLPFAPLSIPASTSSGAGQSASSSPSAFMEFAEEFVSPLADVRARPRMTADAPEPSADSRTAYNRGWPRMDGQLS